MRADEKDKSDDNERCLPYGCNDTYFENLKRIRKMQKSGKYRVIGVDKFDNEDWVEGTYNTAKEAIKVARKKSLEGLSSASDHSIATVYYAYGSNGEYIGGDVGLENQNKYSL